MALKTSELMQSILEQTQRCKVSCKTKISSPLPSWSQVRTLDFGESSWEALDALLEGDPDAGWSDYHCAMILEAEEGGNARDRHSISALPHIVQAVLI